MMWSKFRDGLRPALRGGPDAVIHLSPRSARRLAPTRQFAADPDKFRALVLAYGAAGLMALTLFAGLTTASTAFAGQTLPWPAVNAAVFVFLLSATIVSGGIVVAFWHHLMDSLVPHKPGPVPFRPVRAPRPLRNF